MPVRIEENKALGELGYFVCRGNFSVYCRDEPTAKIASRAFSRLSDAEWQAVIDELIAEADAKIRRAA